MAPPTLPTAPTPAADSSLTPLQQCEKAFCAADAPDVFHSITHHHEVWRPDPLDVESIHEEARAAFQRLLNRATTRPGLPSGRILLLLGEAGSGKTHLMRAFR